MKVINLFGGPGCGKSTTAAGVFYFMKLRGLNVELVTEYVKDLVYDGTLELMLDRQEVIFAEQSQRLHRLRGKVDYTVVDSPLLLSYVYPELNEELKGTPQWPALSAFKNLVIQVVRTYDNVNFFLHRPETFEKDGRIHNEEQSQVIDERILGALRLHQFPFTELTTDSETVDKIIDSIVP